MSTIIQSDQLRTLLLGNRAEKASGAISGDPTIVLFTIAGGQVLVTSFYLVVTTAIATNGGTLALQTNPTTGDSVTVVTATDLGTSDAAVGTTIGLAVETNDTANNQINFAEGGYVLKDLVVTTGAIELVGAASVDGAVTAYVTWVPLTTGATLVAA